MEVETTKHTNYTKDGGGPTEHTDDTEGFYRRKRRERRNSGEVPANYANDAKRMAAKRRRGRTTMGGG